MDGFLKSIQEALGSIPQSKDLAVLAGGKGYAYLRDILSELGPKDDFGGLQRELHEGIGAIWVCEVHRKYNKDTVAFNVMP